METITAYAATPFELAPTTFSRSPSTKRKSAPSDRFAGVLRLCYARQQSDHLGYSVDTAASHGAIALESAPLFSPIGSEKTGQSLGALGRKLRETTLQLWIEDTEIWLSPQQFRVFAHLLLHALFTLESPSPSPRFRACTEITGKR